MIKTALNKNIEFGHTIVDAQHKYIIELSKKIKNFNHEDHPHNSFLSLLRNYRRNIKKHFILEEELLDLLTKKEYLSHKFAHTQSHKEHTNILNGIIRLFLTNKDVDLSKDIISYAFEELHLHILLYDNEMLAFLKIENIFK